MYKPKMKPGFTLVELLIVIVVIAILAAITIVSYSNVTSNAHAVTLQSDLSGGATTLSLSKINTGGYTYPADQVSAGLTASSGDTLTYNVSADQLTYCLQAAGFGLGYAITNTNTTPQVGYCSGTTFVSGAYTPPAQLPAPVLASAGSFGHVSGNTISVPVPSGVASGSLVVMDIHVMWATTTAPTAAALSLPSGWTVGPLYTYYETVDNYSVGLFFAYKHATAADSGYYTLTLNTVAGVAADSTYSLANAIRITGAPTTGNPFVDTSHGNGLTSSNPISIASFTPGGNNSFLLAMVGAEWASINPIGPTGWTKQADSASNTDTEIWSTTQSTAAATGTISWNYGQNIDGLEALVGTIRPGT